MVITRTLNVRHDPQEVMDVPRLNIHHPRLVHIIVPHGTAVGIAMAEVLI